MDEEQWRAMSPAERMKGVKCASVQEIEVLACNWQGVHVYLRCQPTMLAGMGGGVILGVSAQEVLAACRLMRVPVREWPEASEVAQALAAMVAKIENERAKQRASAKARKG